jgi:hypothetical protein
MRLRLLAEIKSLLASQINWEQTAKSATESKCMFV